MSDNPELPENSASFREDEPYLVAPIEVRPDFAYAVLECIKAKQDAEYKEAAYKRSALPYQMIGADPSDEPLISYRAAISEAKASVALETKRAKYNLGAALGLPYLPDDPNEPTAGGHIKADVAGLSSIDVCFFQISGAFDNTTLGKALIEYLDQKVKLAEVSTILARAFGLEQKSESDAELEPALQDLLDKWLLKKQIGDNERSLFRYSFEDLSELQKGALYLYGAQVAFSIINSRRRAPRESVERWRQSDRTAITSGTREKILKHNLTNLELTEIDDFVDACLTNGANYISSLRQAGLLPADMHDISDQFTANDFTEAYKHLYGQVLAVRRGEHRALLKNQIPFISEPV